MNPSCGRKKDGLLLPAAVVCLAGCSAVEPRGDYQRAGEAMRAATGVAETYLPEEEGAVAERVGHLLQDGLTADEAVQVSLLNNPGLQAAFFDVGMARAEVVQSGLFSNPTLAFAVQFPEGGGRSNIQAGLAQNIVDLWQIPVRRQAAERSLDEAVLRLARTAAQLCIDAKTAYFTAAAADQGHAIAKENLDLTQRLLDTALARQKAGVVGELDVNLNRQTVLGAQLEVQQTRLDAAAARRRLGRLLGLTIPTEELALTTPLSSSAQLPANPDDLLAIAREHRLDLQAARMAAEAAAARLETECRKVFPEISVGLSAERSERRAQAGRKPLADAAWASIANGALTAPDIQSPGQRDLEQRQDIDFMLGPSFDLTLPIFDQNQAQIAKARLAYEQAAKNVDALERGLVQEIRQALDQARTASEIVGFYEGSLLPQSLINLDLSRSSYESGRTSLIVVLEAQRGLLTARRAAVTARQTAATALAELERATAQPLSVLENIAAPAMQSDSPPADRAAEAVP